MQRPVDPSEAVSAGRMHAIDAEAIERLGLPRLLLMEHAGRALADAALALFSRASCRIVVCCGTGYNGGDGLCAAWHLAHRGHQVTVVLAGRIDELREEPMVYARILQALHVPFHTLHGAVEVAGLETMLTDADLLIDALLGIGVQGPVRPLYAALIERMNESGAPIVAADMPSGLDADTGMPQGCAVRAAVTVTFGAPKQGLFRGDGPSVAGRVIVDDLEIPEALIRGPSS